MLPDRGPVAVTASTVHPWAGDDLTDPVRVEAVAAELVARMSGYGRTLVAFSGGVDSSVVLAAAVRALGAAEVVALTAVSPAVPRAEVATAASLCVELGVAHRQVGTREMDVSGYRDNGPTRCYFCKSTLLDTAATIARAEGLTSVATGTNASDVVAGFRPGIRAGAERGVRTPLADAGLDKASVRAIARLWGLSTWDKPAAACLSSRVAYGVAITPARLARVERAEIALRELLGARTVNLRVRDLGESVRLEVDGPLVAEIEADGSVRQAVRDAGFGDTALSIESFRSGSMNELLAEPQRWRRS